MKGIFHFTLKCVLILASFYEQIETISLHNEQTGRRQKGQQSRPRRNMQHPAFSMIMGSPMSFPGFPMHDSSREETLPECITGDIVCPAWCLMEDDWGCKYCPCGPANGMSPPKISEHRHTEPRHEEDCIGTLLCMLSCKEGYKLGPRDSEHGCQSCTCVKKNESESDYNTTTFNTRNNTAGSHTSNQPCAWPLCMNGNGPNNGPGSGASMTSLPIGGVKTGGSLPGVDCIGAACSAKNGMQMSHGSLPVTPAVPQPQPRPFSTPSSWRPTTKRPPVTAPPQQSLLLVAPTKPPKQLYVVPIHTEVPKRACSSLDYCMNNCHYGFQVQNSRNNCPDCSCILPKSPPAPTISTPKPDFTAIMRVCPDAVHCMNTCTHGYTLSSSHTETCPLCTCNKEPKVLLLCERPMSCQNGCTVGYKGDRIGCPTCNCVSPSETKLQIKVLTTKIDTALTCNRKFSCVDKCNLGYKTGDNGCPTCVCLEHVTDQTQIARPVIVQPSKLNCDGPKCSAVHAVPPQIKLLCEQPLSCPYGCTVGFKCDNQGCPICNCISPSETINKVEVQRIVVGKVLVCGKKFACQQRCGFGFRTGTDGCPSCTCLQPIAAHQGNTFFSAMETGQLDNNDKLLPTSSHIQTAVKIIAGPKGTPDVQNSLSAMETCPDSVNCMMGCKGTYKLTPHPGEDCPECHCINQGSDCFGPSCSAPGSHHPALEVSTPSPGECVTILHCVLTCESGYDIGEYSRDGCPTCTCVQ